MSGNAPTLINLPPPPSDPVTPSDMGPGTPNSGTTTMSELSTVAIKDGHRGHLSHHHHPNDAERADRISRLAGLERVATARQANLSAPGSGPNPALPHGGTTSGSYAAAGGMPQGWMGAGSGGPGTGTAPVGYFDATNNPAMMRERSTVGSASATGSVGGRTTWASGSDVYEPDKMSDTADADLMVDHETTSTGTGGFSDEAQSLVGFGEGARTPARQHSALGSPTTAGKPAPLGATAVGSGSGSAVPPYLRDHTGSGSPAPVMHPSSPTTPLSVEAQRQEARLIDGMSYDTDVVDTADQTPPSAADVQARRNLTTAETTERVMRERAAKGQKLGDDDVMRD